MLQPTSQLPANLAAGPTRAVVENDGDYGAHFWIFGRLAGRFEVPLAAVKGSGWQFQKMLSECSQRIFRLLQCFLEPVEAVSYHRSGVASEGRRSNRLRRTKSST
jgi:hypothetical protein